MAINKTIEKVQLAHEIWADCKKAKFDINHFHMFTPWVKASQGGEVQFCFYWVKTRMASICYHRSERGQDARMLEPITYRKTERGTFRYWIGKKIVQADCSDEFWQEMYDTAIHLHRFYGVAG